MAICCTFHRGLIRGMQLSSRCNGPSPLTSWHLWHSRGMAVSLCNSVATTFRSRRTEAFVVDEDDWQRRESRSCPWCGVNGRLWWWCFLLIHVWPENYSCSSWHHRTAGPGRGHLHKKYGFSTKTCMPATDKAFSGSTQKREWFSYKGGVLRVCKGTIQDSIGTRSCEKKNILRIVEGPFDSLDQLFAEVEHAFTNTRV